MVPSKGMVFLFLFFSIFFEEFFNKWSVLPFDPIKDEGQDKF